MFHSNRSGPALVLGSILVFSAGCGSSSPVVNDGKTPGQRVEEMPLTQLADVLRIYDEEKHSPPSSNEELLKFQKIYPAGIGKLKDGEIVLFPGAGIQDGASDRVLAYEKQAPEKGGQVLMQDGKTIKKMTADEFKAAPKAGKG